MREFYGILISMFFLSALVSNADDSYSVKFGGYVKTDALMDTRQVESLREGHFLLYPKPENLDKNKDDINKGTTFNMLSVQTRAFTKIEGPGIWGGKTSGYIEAEFFGSSEAGINSFRLRHAYVDMDWGTTQIKAGQYWHPMFPNEAYPEVISFNTGVPFVPFARSPQIRITQKFDNFKIFVAAVSERDFTSSGPDGSTSAYMKNAGIPEFTLGINYSKPNVMMGVNASYKTLKPALSTKNAANEIYKSDDKISSYAADAYLKLSYDGFTFKAMGTYGLNTTDLLMLGGYAVKSVDIITGATDYTSYKIMSVWSEIMYKKDWEVGIFGGYQKNLGTEDQVMGAVYARNANIDNLFRVSPRIAYNFNKTKLALEAEYTSAAYGTVDLKDNNKVKDTKTVGNLRILLGFYIFF